MGVRVSAEAWLGLEQRHVVGLRQQIRGREPCDARADDGNFHGCRI